MAATDAWNVRANQAIRRSGAVLRTCYVLPHSTSKYAQRNLRKVGNSNGPDGGEGQSDQGGRMARMRCSVPVIDSEPDVYLCPFYR